jgi:hypothetical protein
VGTLRGSRLAHASGRLAAPMMHHPWSYEPPRRLDPVDRSIAALLQTLNAAHWTDWLPRRSSPEDVEAVEALLAVGFLEMKCSPLLLQPGDRWGHEVQATFCGASGGGAAEAPGGPAWTSAQPQAQPQGAGSGQKVGEMGAGRAARRSFSSGASRGHGVARCRPKRALPSSRGTSA